MVGADYNGRTAFIVTLAIATGLILPKLFIEHYFAPDRRAYRVESRDAKEITRRFVPALLDRVDDDPQGPG